MDDEAFLDDEIYDDDSPDHHPVDDDDLGVLGGLARPPDPSVDAPDLQPASCFTPEYLAALAGTDNLEACTFLEMRADTTDEDLSGVGRLMPALAQLRLSNSVLPEMRAFGSAFQRLTVLWIARSEVEDLAGVASLVDLRELYAAFNEVSDVSPLAELDHLQVVDLEGNCVEDPDAPDYLGMCPRLSSLSLEGNPLSRRTYYRRIVCRAIPRLRVLDDRDVDDAIDRMEIPDGLEDEEGPEPNADDANDANDAEPRLRRLRGSGASFVGHERGARDGDGWNQIRGGGDRRSGRGPHPGRGDGRTLRGALGRALGRRFPPGKQRRRRVQPRRPRRVLPQPTLRGRIPRIEAGERLPAPAPGFEQTGLEQTRLASRFASEFASRERGRGRGRSRASTADGVVGSREFARRRASRGARKRGEFATGHGGGVSLSAGHGGIESKRFGVASRNRRELGRARGVAAEHRVSTEFAGTAGDGAVGGVSTGDGGVRRRVGVGGVRRRGGYLVALLAQK